MAGDQHHLRLRQQLGVVEQAHAVAVGQLQVEQHDVGRLQRELPPGVTEVVCSRHGEVVAGHQRSHHLRRIDVVFDNESVSHLGLFCPRLCVPHAGALARTRVPA